MKQLITFLLFVTMFSFTANAQLPNPGFEFLNSDSTTQYWLPMDAISIGLNDSFLTDGYTVRYSTQSRTGNYAIELRNAYNVTQNSAVNGNIYGTPDSATAGFINYVPITIYPTSFSFYYQFIQNPYIDTLVCTVQILNSNYDEIAFAETAVWDVHMGYQLRTMPLTYQSATDSVPAYARIRFRNRVVAGPHVGERVLIDDVSLNGNPLSTSSLTNQHIALYPNPVNQELSLTGAEWYTRFTIRSLSGQALKTGKLSDRIVTTELAAGMYYFVLENQEGSHVLKFTKQ